MATFPYKSDVGTHSYLAIEAVAKQSGLPVKASSDFRPGSITITGNKSYHSFGNAVDFVTSKANMVSFAQWVSKNFAPYTLELIHSGGGGIYVRNGVRGYQYSAPIVAEHWDHVHWAITLSGLRAAGAAYTGQGVAIEQTSLQDTSAPGVGCAVPASIITAVVGSGLWTLISNWPFS